jgi:hypothetical protein
MIIIFFVLILFDQQDNHLTRKTLISLFPSVYKYNYYLRANSIDNNKLFLHSPLFFLVKVISDNGDYAFFATAYIKTDILLEFTPDFFAYSLIL